MAQTLRERRVARQAFQFACLDGRICERKIVNHIVASFVYPERVEGWTASLPTVWQNH
jgi:hypothetical protein